MPGLMFIRGIPAAQSVIVVDHFYVPAPQPHLIDMPRSTVPLSAPSPLLTPLLAKQLLLSPFMITLLSRSPSLSDFYDSADSQI